MKLICWAAVTITRCEITQINFGKLPDTYCICVSCVTLPAKDPCPCRIIFSRVTRIEVFRRSRPGKPNQRKGKRKVRMNVAHFLWILKQARFTLNYCSGMPLWKVHEPTFLWFGLPGPLLTFPSFLGQCFRGEGYWEKLWTFLETLGCSPLWLCIAKNPAITIDRGQHLHCQSHWRCPHSHWRLGAAKDTRHWRALPSVHRNCGTRCVFCLD